MVSLTEENQMKSGIYRFINWIDGKMYIGSAVVLANRKKNHLIELRLNRHFNRYLQAAYNKHGANNFVFEVLEYVEYKNNLILREQYWLDKFKSYNREFGYNLSPTASSPLGVKHTDEAKVNMGAAAKGKSHSKEWNEKIRIANTGKIATLETRQTISKALKGRKLSQEHAEKIGEYKRNVVKYPCPKGYYCPCVDCKDKRADATRRYRLRKLQMENNRGT